MISISFFGGGCHDNVVCFLCFPRSEQTKVGKERLKQLQCKGTEILKAAPFKTSSQGNGTKTLSKNGKWGALILYCMMWRVVLCSYRWTNKAFLHMLQILWLGWSMPMDVSTFFWFDSNCHSRFFFNCRSELFSIWWDCIIYLTITQDKRNMFWLVTWIQWHPTTK